MGLTEYVLLIVLVIGLPLAIAGAVTLWSLKQVRYRPQQRRPPAPVSEPPAAERPSSTENRSDASSA